MTQFEHIHDSETSDHLARLRSAVKESYDLAQIPRWITDNTYLKGAKYSFKDHEFQETIISDTSQIVNVIKCSQVGLSEVMARWTVGVCEVFPGFGAIVTFPFSGDAEDFCRTRIDPFITSSPKLQAAINPKLNNAEVKQIHESLLYFRGTNGKTQAISTPADAIISDEIDRSDPDTLTQFTSRLTHSPYKLRRNFSTPTISGWGISLEMETSRRFKNLCKCNHCNHWFIPDFYEHVKIPDFTGDLKSLTKMNLQRTRYLESVLLCPKCGRIPDLFPKNREWVQENPMDKFEAAGYYVSPFDAPALITPVDLVKSSTQYSKRSEFDNQALGKVSEDQSEALTLVDLNRAKTIVDLSSAVQHAMGIDVGLICTITVGRMTIDNKLLVVWREQCVVGQLEVRKAILKLKYRIAITVMDCFPYTDLVQRMQAVDPTLFGGIYVDTPTAETYAIKMFEGDAEDGKLPVHLAKIHRDKGFDELLGMFKADEIKIYEQDKTLDEEYDKHCLDMKRVQVFDKFYQLVFTWIKSKVGVDHYMHSTLYLLAACKLRGVVIGKVPLLGTGSPMIRRFSTNTKTTGLANR